jgi:hypothetical protein
MPGVAQGIAAFVQRLPAQAHHLAEADPRFEILRVSLLSSAERWLAFSLAHYRRSLEMLVPVSAPWAHVTLYYSSFYAANAILAMFGGWIGQLPIRRGLRVVDVGAFAVGNQRLVIHVEPPSPNGATGSHRVFWDFFYDGAAHIAQWAPAKLRPALAPVNGNYGWQIAERNRVNYDMFEAWASATFFSDHVDASRLRRTLRGNIGQQFEITEMMLRLAVMFAKTLSLECFGLIGCGIEGPRHQIQKRLIRQAPTSAVMQSALHELLDA